MDFIESANKTANNILDTYIYGNPVISSVLSLFLVLYAGLAAPKLPKKIAKLFGNEVFRIIVLVCIAYMASKDSSMSIISAVALVISLQTLSYHEANEVVASTIADEASKIQVEDNQEFIFDETEEIPPVFESQPEPTESEPEPTESEPVEPQFVSEAPVEASEELEFPTEDSVQEVTVSEPEPVLTDNQVQDEEEVDYHEDDHEETTEEPVEKPAPVAKELPQGDDTKDHPHAGYHVHPAINENSGKIQDNTNRIGELEKLMKPSKTEPKPAPTESQFDVIAFGGEAYAEF